MIVRRMIPRGTENKMLLDQMGTGPYQRGIAQIKASTTYGRARYP